METNLTREEKALAKKRAICMGIVHPTGITIPIADTGLYDSLWIPLAEPLSPNEKQPDGNHILCIAVYKYADMVKGWEPDWEGVDATDSINQLGPPTRPVYQRLVKLYGNSGGSTPLLYFGRKPGFFTLWADAAFGCEIINFYPFNDVLARLEGNNVPPNAIDSLGQPTIKFKL